MIETRGLTRYYCCAYGDPVGRSSLLAKYDRESRAIPGGYVGMAAWLRKYPENEQGEALIHQFGESLYFLIYESGDRKVPMARMAIGLVTSVMNNSGIPNIIVDSLAMLSQIKSSDKYIYP
jgi:hypothetical protein